MGLVLLAMLVFALSLVNGLGEPGPGTPTFIRSAVEQMPNRSYRPVHPFLMKQSYSSGYSEFGTKSLPLRSAVESIPSVPLYERIPLRDAVEYRPIDDERRERSSRSVRFQYESGKYDAFLIPNQDFQSPQPFRTGSPFQQLVDISADPELSLNQHQLFDVFHLTSSALRKEDRVPVLLKQMPGDRFVLCYFTNWAFYRKGDGQFAPENIDPSLCTHVIYSFASLDAETLLIREFDPWADMDNNLYQRTTSLGIPALLAVGGWTDSVGDKYSRLVRDPQKRSAFIQHSVQFLKRYGFKGMSFEWNYPKCWQSDCRKGSADDRQNFATFISELRRVFVQNQLILGIGVSGYMEVIRQAYDMRSLSENVDFMNVMAYDYHGAWEGKTGHISPLYARPGDKHPQYNTDVTIQEIIKLGANPKKVILGIAFYGQTFTLKELGPNNQLVGEGADSYGPGSAGEFTRQPGMWSYYEICDKIRRERWNVGRDPNMKSGAYASSINQWVGFEDPQSIEVKMKYLISNGLGGASAWTIDLDDFTNKCCGTPFTLLKAINRGLGRYNKPATTTDCARPPGPVTPLAPIMSTVGENGPTEGVHQHTTWPSWQPSTNAPTTTTTRRPVTTTTVGTSAPWWTESTQTQTWWPTSTTTTTQKPTTTTTRWTTTTQRPTTTTQRPTTTTQGTTIPVPINVQPVYLDETCSGNDHKPDRTDCNAYYRCVGTEYVKQNCVAGLHWNQQKMICDWPAAAKCTTEQQLTAQDQPWQAPVTTTRTTTTQRPTTTTKWTTRPTTTTSPWWTTTTRRTTTQSYLSHTTNKRPSAAVAQQQPCNAGQYYPSRDCKSYIICINNKRVKRPCPSGLQYSVEQNTCDWPENVKCVSVKDYNRWAGLRIAEGDDCVEGTTVRHPSDCEKYYRCVHSRYQEETCANSLQFNADRLQCDWPANAKCTAGPAQADYFGSGTGGSPSQPQRPQKPQPVEQEVAVDHVGESYNPNDLIPVPDSNYAPLSTKYKVVCYFTNWAWYRKGVGKYVPEDIDIDLCTHIIYGFAVLDYSELIIRTHDSWADIDNKFYERVAGLKAKGKHVSLALGGWNDSQGDKYSRLVRSPQARARFVTQSIEFIERFGFGGLDLDWEYPVCWQVDCKKGFPDEKEGFAALARDLSAAFKPKGLLLSAAVSPSKMVIDAGYDVPAMARYLDWIAVMTYDYHGQWDKKTGHVAPLFYHPEDEVDNFNANFSINYWMQKGAPADKLVMGMPLYGQSFTLADSKRNGLNSKAPGPGEAGEFTKAAGFLAYYEICDRIKNKGWKIVRDPLGRMGPFAYKGNQWVSYDDQHTLKRKSQLVKSLNLAGGMIWALDLDDFKNRCGEGRHPLLKIIREELRDDGNVVAPTPAPDHRPMEPAPIPTQDNPPLYNNEIDAPVQAGVSGSQGEDNVGEVEVFEENAPDYQDVEVDQRTDFKVVCYFTNWAWYRQSGGKFLPEDIDPELCTHIVFGFAVLNRDTLTIQPHDPWADIDNRFYERVVELKKKGLKVTLAIGGWNDSAGDKYSRLVLSAASRTKFAEHVMEFIQKYNFDGLDLDWEYPVCWQVDCTKGSPIEKEGFSELVKELSRLFKPKGLLLSSAVSPSKKVIDAGYDVKTLSNYFDWIAVMTYDYHGQWDKQTGHVAPMYEHPTDVEPTFNANFSINYWIDRGAERKKLVMGMPMYGQSFSLADNNKHGLNAMTYGGGEAGDATRARGFLSYYEICQNIKNKGWHVVRDRKGRMGPYAYLRDQWVSFDDVNMIRHKSQYVRAMELGGAMIWALDLDDFRNVCGCEEYPLLRTINRELRGYPRVDPICKLETITEYEGDESRKPTYVEPVTTKRPTTTRRPSWPSKPAVQPVQHEEPTQTERCTAMFKPDKTDCSKYYICLNGDWEPQQCSAGLYWNQNRCDWPASSSCKQDPSLVTEAPTTARPPVQPIYDELHTEKPNPPHAPDAVSQPYPVLDSPYKVVCYFTNWAWYRPGDGKYTPDDIDANLCTHIVYGFAVLNRDTLTIKTHDSWADIDNRFYERVVEYKKKGIRVTLAIGGWNDSLGDKYSRLVRSSQARARFVKHVAEFIEKYGFEGLDLDWEYPVCWQVECDKGYPEEKQGFADLVRELAQEFRPRGWLLSAAVSPSKMVIDKGYDVPTLAEYFDWIAVMTYDFHGHWDKQTGHVAPLYHYPGDTYEYFNANFTMHYWMEKGAPASKLIMGMPLYGQSFTLADSTKTGLNSKAPGPGEAGEFTRAGGFLAYYEICDRINKGGWKVMKDPEGRIGPYAHKGAQWVSYDDVEQIRRKTQVIKKLNLAGGMVWALDLDDFRGKCGCGKHPLLTTLNQELRGLGGPHRNDCT